MNIKATIPAGVDAITVHGLTQWDYGRKLEIRSDDLPAMVEVHFACAGMKDAVVRSCNVVGGVVEAAIPDTCLEQTSPVIAWVYEIGTTAGATILTITMPITARTRPQPGATIPEEISDKYTEAVAAMNAAVAQLTAGNVIVRQAKEAEVAGQAREAAFANRAEFDHKGNVIAETYGNFANTFVSDDILPGLGVYYVEAKLSGGSGTLAGLVFYNGSGDFIDTGISMTEADGLGIYVYKMFIRGQSIIISMHDADSNSYDMTAGSDIRYIRIK